MRREEFSMDEMRKISYEIILDELEKNGIKKNIYPVTFIEYYRDYILKKPLRLSPKVFFPGNCSLGFYDAENHDIVIFLHHLKKIKRIENRFLELVVTCYHEVRHTIQETFDSYTYEGFLREIENYIRGMMLDEKDSKNYNEYSFEIGAQLYAISKARKYLKSKYPDLYMKQKNMIDKLEKQVRYYYLTYDVVGMVDTFIQAIRKNNQNLSSKGFFSVEKLSKGVDKLSIPSVAKLFLDERYHFKSIQQINRQAKLHGVDERILYAFLSSKAFLEGVRVENLSEEEGEFLKEALQYSNTIYQNQIHSIEKMYEEGVIRGVGVFLTRLSLEEHITRIRAYQEGIFNDSKMIQKGKKR